MDWKRELSLVDDPMQPDNEISKILQGERGPAGWGKQYLTMKNKKPSALLMWDASATVNLNEKQKCGPICEFF